MYHSYTVAHCVRKELQYNKLDNSLSFIRFTKHNRPVCVTCIFDYFVFMLTHQKKFASNDEQHFMFNFAAFVTLFSFQLGGSLCVNLFVSFGNGLTNMELFMFCSGCKGKIRSSSSHQSFWSLLKITEDKRVMKMYGFYSVVNFQRILEIVFIVFILLY